MEKKQRPGREKRVDREGYGNPHARLINDVDEACNHPGDVSGDVAKAFDSAVARDEHLRQPRIACMVAPLLAQLHSSASVVPGADQQRRRLVELAGVQQRHHRVADGAGTPLRTFCFASSTTARVRCCPRAVNGSDDSDSGPRRPCKSISAMLAGAHDDVGGEAAASAAKQEAKGNGDGDGEAAPLLRRPQLRSDYSTHRPPPGGRSRGRSRHPRKAESTSPSISGGDRGSRSGPWRQLKRWRKVASRAVQRKSLPAGERGADEVCSGGEHRRKTSRRRSLVSAATATADMPFPSSLPTPLRRSHPGKRMGGPEEGEGEGEETKKRG
uniref:Uncharacterized protein n=1 Tax=Oryza sativa subsp. japonica TaxID=39947 RepID=Q6L4Q5_ORYSJ|nr:hypothetical protein [Oryza sativa Japonica Group]